MPITTPRDTFIKIIKRQLPKANDPKGTDHLMEDLGADDFDLAVIREELEEKLTINIEDATWDQCGTVDETAAVIKRLTERHY